MILLDVFKYFAKFPLRKAVQDAFASGKSSFSGYDPIKAYVEEMSEHSIFPSITGFIIGADEESVLKQLNSVNGTFMFFDYGEIGASKDARNCIQNSWVLAITIANKLSTDCDIIEFALNSDLMLSFIRDILVKIELDQKEKPWLKELSNSYQLVPFNVKERNSHGWTLVFTREGADMLNIKNL